LRHNRRAGISRRGIVLILYEYPLNERVRTLLRLEDLFTRLNHFFREDHPLSHHVALVTLFELLEVSARADLKSDLLQELDRQRQTLLGYRSNPRVSSAALEQILGQIEVAWSGINSAAGRTGQHIRDNEWLMSIRSRTAIAGGACVFDLPSYFAWQNRSTEERQRDITLWAAPFLPLEQGVSIILKLLRESAQSSTQVAENGSFQQPLGGKTYQMVQVRLDPATGAIPELSANKYLLWIRFTTQGGDLRPRAYDGDVEFELALCNL